MKTVVEQWMKALAPVAGVLAVGVQLGDKSCLSRSWSDPFSESALEGVWRAVADVFPVLKLNHLPAGRLRWIYERALLYCERREDGLWLGVFTARDPQLVDMSGVARLLQEFHGLGGGPLKREP
jgi:hypothetical protein